jgi:hypothetical protein
MRRLESNKVMNFLLKMSYLIMIFLLIIFEIFDLLLS